MLKNEDELPYTFFVQDVEVVSTLKERIHNKEVLDRKGEEKKRFDFVDIAKHKVGVEEVVQVVYEPQAIFRVRAVTRCTSSMPGTSPFPSFFLPLPSFSFLLKWLTRYRTLRGSACSMLFSRW